MSGHKGDGSSYVSLLSDLRLSLRGRMLVAEFFGKPRAEEGEPGMGRLV
jgi:hypothetical protein